MINQKIDIREYFKKNRELIDLVLERHFSSPAAPAILRDAMTYSLFAGGKRVRPILALASYEACGGVPEEILPCAASLELIHTYSLIHDDLPAMDDDDLRRGKPTNHKVFGEGMAILAGDALLTEAFYMISDFGFRISDSRDRNSAIRNPQSAILRVIREIALAAGAHGMVGGQAEDVLAEDAAFEEDRLSFIHAHKTGALITASVRTGAILAGADEALLFALTRYGEKIGLAFQIVDDVLDVKGDSAEMGKNAGSDERMKKMTYPGLYGMEASMRLADECIESALDAISSFPDKAEPLREIACYILKRNN